MSGGKNHYVLTATAERDFPLAKKLIAIVALIRQTRDVPTIIEANGFMIRRELKALRQNISSNNNQASNAVKPGTK